MTHAFIGLQISENIYKTIYCHSDGYLEGVGYVLNEYYKDRSKVETLISLGNIESL